MQLGSVQSAAQSVNYRLVQATQVTRAAVIGVQRIAQQRVRFFRFVFVFVSFSFLFRSFSFSFRFRLRLFVFVFVFSFVRSFFVFSFRFRFVFVYQPTAAAVPTASTFFSFRFRRCCIPTSCCSSTVETGRADGGAGASCASSAPFLDGRRVQDLSYDEMPCPRRTNVRVLFQDL